MSTATKISASDRRHIRSHLDRAVSLDADLAKVIAEVGYPEPRKRAADFATLLQVIVSQQLSTKVAAVITARLQRLCHGQITWRKILLRSEQQLRDCGLSWRKVEYARNLAMMIRDRQLQLSDFPQMETEEVIRQLVAIRGFGRWSGEIFAMFALQRHDIYPADDLALQVAVQRYAGLSKKPGGRDTTEFAQRWSPYRTSVALLMWKYYGATTLVHCPG